VAHYKTTDTTKTGTTDAAAAAAIAFSISGATSGYAVKVDVNVAGKEISARSSRPSRPETVAASGARARTGS